MKSLSLGSARTLLLAALALAAAVMVGSVIFMATRDDGRPGDRTDPEDGEDGDPGDQPRGRSPKSRTPKTAAGEADEGDDGEGDAPQFFGPGGREPTGEEFVVTDET